MLERFAGSRLRVNSSELPKGKKNIKLAGPLFAAALVLGGRGSVQASGSEFNSAKPTPSISQEKNHIFCPTDPSQLVDTMGGREDGWSGEYPTFNYTADGNLKTPDVLNPVKASIVIDVTGGKYEIVTARPVDLAPNQIVQVACEGDFPNPDQSALPIAKSQNGNCEKPVRIAGQWYARPDQLVELPVMKMKACPPDVKGFFPTQEQLNQSTATAMKSSPKFDK